MAWIDPNPGSARPTAIRHAGVYFGTRLVNALFTLVHAAITVRVLGATEAGTFFLFWTATWLLASLLKFGLDGILPRLVAEAGGDAALLPSSRPIVRAGTLTAVAACPLVLWGFDLVSDPFAPALALGLALSWAAVQVLGGLVRAYGRADVSGFIANVVWSGIVMLAPLTLPAGARHWTTLAAVTLGLSVVAVLAAVVLARRVVGPTAVRRLTARRTNAIEIDADVVGAAVLTALYEVLVWLPVLLAAVARVSHREAAAVFTATRLAGLISWGYQSVVAVVTPRLAGALAARDIRYVRRILNRASLAGLLATLPPALIAIAAASPALALFDPTYTVFATGLSLLAASRVADGLTGAVGEALLVGRRTWVDIWLVIAGVVVSLVITLVVSPGSELFGIGAGAAGGWTATNILRIVAVRRLLTQGWRGPLLRQPMPSSVKASALLAAAALPPVVVLSVHPGGAPAALLGAGCAVLGALTVGFVAIRSPGALRGVATPLTVVALVTFAEFGLRAASLAADPGSATEGVLLLGYRPATVAWTAAFGTAALLALAIGFIWTAHRRVLTTEDLTVRALAPAWRRRLVAVLGVGTFLWLVLFMRSGGPQALINDPASLHLNQFGGLYGVIGLLMCLGTVLVTLHIRLTRPNASAGLVLAGAALLSLAGSTALASRAPLMATAVAGAVIILRERRPHGRMLVLGLVVVVIGVFGSLVARSVREYAQQESVSAAVASTVQTPPLTFLTADLNEFDHFVGLSELVPDPLGHLHGESLSAVPTVFIPRAIWPGKPLPIDFRLGQALYGETAAAGTPMTLPGELFWNFGTVGGIVGMLGLGLLFGALWRLIGRIRSETRLLVHALIVGYTYLLLTRPLAPMTQTAVAATLSLAIAAAAAGMLEVVWPRFALPRSLPRLRPPAAPLERAPVAAASVPPDPVLGLLWAPARSLQSALKVLRGLRPPSSPLESRG